MDKQAQDERIFNKIIEVKDLTEDLMKTMLLGSISAAHTPDEIETNLEKLISKLKGMGEDHV